MGSLFGSSSASDGESEESTRMSDSADHPPGRSDVQTAARDVSGSTSVSPQAPVDHTDLRLLELPAAVLEMIADFAGRVGMLRCKITCHVLFRACEAAMRRTSELWVLRWPSIGLALDERRAVNYYPLRTTDTAHAELHADDVAVLERLSRRIARQDWLIEVDVTVDCHHVRQLMPTVTEMQAAMLTGYMATKEDLVEDHGHLSWWKPENLTVQTVPMMRC